MEHQAPLGVDAALRNAGGKSERYPSFGYDRGDGIGVFTFDHQVEDGGIKRVGPCRCKSELQIGDRTETLTAEIVEHALHHLGDQNFIFHNENTERKKTVGQVGPRVLQGRRAVDRCPPAEPPYSVTALTVPLLLFFGQKKPGRSMPFRPFRRDHPHCRDDPAIAVGHNKSPRAPVAPCPARA